MPYGTNQSLTGPPAWRYEGDDSHRDTATLANKRRAGFGFRLRQFDLKQQLDQLAGFARIVQGCTGAAKHRDVRERPRSATVPGLRNSLSSPQL